MALCVLGCNGSVRIDRSAEPGPPRGFGAADWGSTIGEVESLVPEARTRISSWQELLIGQTRIPVRYDYEFKSGKLQSGSIHLDSRNGMPPTAYQVAMLFRWLKNRHGDPKSIRAFNPNRILVVDIVNPDIAACLENPENSYEWDWVAGPSFALRRMPSGQIRCFVKYPRGSDH